jgi:hypothetical protein
MDHVWHTIEYCGNTLIFLLAGLITGRHWYTSNEIEWMDTMRVLLMFVCMTAIRGLMMLLFYPALSRLGFGTNMNVEFVERKKGLKVLDHCCATLKGWRIGFNFMGPALVEPSWANALQGADSDEIHVRPAVPPPPSPLPLARFALRVLPAEPPCGLPRRLLPRLNLRASRSSSRPRTSSPWTARRAPARAKRPTPRSRCRS